MPLTSICQMPYKWKWTQTLVQFSSEVHWDLYDVYVKIKVFILFKPILEQLEKVCTINYSSKTWCNLFVCLSRGFLFRLTLGYICSAGQLHLPHLPMSCWRQLKFHRHLGIPHMPQNPITHLHTCTCFDFKYSMIPKYFPRLHIKPNAIDSVLHIWFSAKYKPRTYSKHIPQAFRSHSQTKRMFRLLVI